MLHDPRRCDCPCHSTALGNARALAERLDQTAEWRCPARYGETHRAKYHAEREAANYVGVTTDDALAAVFACATCRDRHCPALQSPAPPARERTPWVDPPAPLPPTPQADGGEGAE